MSSTKDQKIARKRNWSKLQVASIQGQARCLITKGSVTTQERRTLVHIEHYATVLLNRWKEKDVLR